MKEVHTGEVASCLERHRDAGLHVDERLLTEVARPDGRMYLWTEPTVTGFLSLVWQSIDETRPIVPEGHPRTLRDCAVRLSGFEWRFDSLVRAGRSWFETCVDVDAAFDYSKFGCIVVTPLNSREADETPGGTYYIFDGVHKSIVLAKRLLRQEVKYSPIEVLLLTPRRS